MGQSYPKEQKRQEIDSCSGIVLVHMGQCFLEEEKRQEIDSCPDIVLVHMGQRFPRGAKTSGDLLLS